jgi:signal transduction histidine kinase
MISWIQSHKWQASSLLAGFSLLLFGGTDLFASGFNSLAVSVLFACGVLFSVRFAWLTVASIVISTVAAVALDVRPGANGLTVVLSLVLVSAFGRVGQRLTAVVAAIASGTLLVANTVFLSDHLLATFGVTAFSFNSKFTLFLLGFALVLSVNLLAWLLGRLLMTRSRHVGTVFDRAVAERTQAKLALEVAEQNERFKIARDISELVIQRVSAAISIAEGGVYATKSDPNSAPRILEQTAESARSAHAELRRLFDMLNKLHEVGAAPPKIDDLETLVIAFRELDYNIYLKHDGKRFEISEGAELAVYRIAFDALENIKNHAPLGTDVSIDFSWTQTGMQLLVKDNGTEVSNRGLSLEQLAYTAEEDRRALTETIKGAGITAMGERAALYGGSIEATRVPGVGFTVSAIFPNLRDTASE